MAVPAWQDYAHIGPGTLAGRYLRSFWQPVYLSKELPPGRARPVHILGMEFTLYRGESGEPHAVAFRCAHRGTQLSTGWVEGENLRCFYHGWTYNGAGECVEQPAEPEPFCQRVHIQAYPVNEYLGTIWAYLGEGAPPEFVRYPRFEEAGVLDADMWPRPVNYFQSLENNIDDAHISFVHRSSAWEQSGYLDFPRATFEETEYGILRRSERANGTVRLSHVLMPLAIWMDGPGDSEGVWPEFLRFRVPVDDFLTMNFAISIAEVSGEAAQRYLERLERQRARRPLAGPLARAVLAGELPNSALGNVENGGGVGTQDDVSMMGQGEIVDREQEHLGQCDVGIVFQRRIYEREMRALAEGRPIKRWTIPAGMRASTRMIDGGLARIGSR
jgi:5,5'-dehydrodivanillate O-demethylase